MDNFLFLPRAFTAAFFDIAFAAALGSLLALFWLGPVSTGSNSMAIVELLRRTLTICAFAMLFLLTVQLCLLTATMLGSSSFPEIRAQLLEVLSGTHAGRVLIPQALAALALLLIASPRHVMANAPGIYLNAIFLGVITCFRAASGHASAQGDFNSAEAIQLLHLASIATWAGGVMIAGLIVVPGLVSYPDTMTELTHYARRLSRTCTWAVFVVLITGLYKGWTGLGESLHPLKNTQWGMILNAKSLLVVAALAIGLKNRLTLNRSPTIPETGAISFSKWLKVEALTMIAIIVLSGLLANSPPVMDS